MAQGQKGMFWRGKAAFNRPLTRALLIGVAITLTSQLYLLPGVDGFRFSGAAILYPVLLVKLLEKCRLPAGGIATAAVVFTYRVLVKLVMGLNFAGAAAAVFPGALFYLCYDMLFCVLVPNRKKTAMLHFFLGCFLADMLSNFVELGFSSGFQYATQPDGFHLLLGEVAAARSACAAVLLWWLGYYRRRLLLEERERRYQRLFMMTAQLKDELYFLKKTASDIERVMGKAYQLYEGLADGPPETQQACQLALDIARDVHEVKKGHLRILKGIEAEVDASYDREVMHIGDLMKILKASARKISNNQNPHHIQVVIEVGHDFVTHEHHRLMSVLRNLVTNAIEAIEKEETDGTIWVQEYLEGNDIVFRVKDDGPGVPLRIQDKIFHIGYSTKFNPVTGDINRGMGLTAVKSLTEELGGTVVMETKPGDGCCFLVRIPRVKLEENYADLHH